MTFAETLARGIEVLQREGRVDFVLPTSGERLQWSHVLSNAETGSSESHRSQH
jgi:hypothetical protein